MPTRIVLLSFVVFVAGAAARASGPSYGPGATVLGRYHVDSVREGAVTWHEPRDDQFRDACNPVTDETGYTPPVDGACDRDVVAVTSNGEIALLQADPETGEFTASFLLRTHAIVNKPCQNAVSPEQAGSGLFGTELCRAGAAAGRTAGQYFFATSGDPQDPYGAAESAAIFTGGLLAFPIGQASAFRLSVSDTAGSAIQIEERRLSILFVPVKTIERYHLVRIGD